MVDCECKMVLATKTERHEETQSLKMKVNPLINAKTQPQCIPLLWRGVRQDGVVNYEW